MEAFQGPRWRENGPRPCPGPMLDRPIRRSYPNSIQVRPAFMERHWGRNKLVPVEYIVRFSISTTTTSLSLVTLMTMIVSIILSMLACMEMNGSLYIVIIIIE